MFNLRSSSQTQALALVGSILVFACRGDAAGTKTNKKDEAELVREDSGVQDAAVEAEAEASADADVPFTLSLDPFTIEGIGGLQSMVHARHEGKLIMLGGRTNGMHAFPPQRGPGAAVWSFPPDKANDMIYVVDLGGRTLLGAASVNDLPDGIANQLRATNLQFFTRDGKLYVVGGYTTTADKSSMVTLDQVIAIDLGELTAVVVGGQALDAGFADQHIAVGDHPALQITGGHIGLLGENVLLAFGQMYNGLYVIGGGVAQQEYSQSVRELEFAIVNGGKEVKVTYIGKDPNPPLTEPQPLPDGPYHRRDYSLAPMLTLEGTTQLAVFGGVFKGGKMEGYVHPIYIQPAVDGGEGASKGKLHFELTEDQSTSQLLSQYETAVVPVYSQSQGVMFATFFGGISQFYWDPTTQALVRDTPNFNADPIIDGLPFINSISTLRIGRSGGDFLHVDEHFPPVGAEMECSGVKAPYGGTNSIFVAEPEVPNQDSVFLLDRIEAPTVVGYVLGGIASTKPYPGPATCASTMIYAVTLTPNSPTKTTKLQAP